MRRKYLASIVALFALLAAAAAPPAAGSGMTNADQQMPRYRYIFVIMEENKDFDDLIGNANAPTINALARQFGIATHFYAETHPSEPNYVALIGGSTFGIRDDNAYFCKPRDARKACGSSDTPGYVDHTIKAPSLATQLEAAGLTWKNYLESLPEPGSLALTAGDSRGTGLPPDLAVYASKHSGFINFASVQMDPHRARHLVGFDQLHSDLRSGDVPNFSFVVPNVCNDMHASGDPDAPGDCSYRGMPGVIRRGDSHVKSLLAAIMSSPIWRSGDNAAIVITTDEDDGGGKRGCCGNDPADPANAGGGHIPTVVVTNHGVRGVSDGTPYSHYSLLRTIEDAFGIHTYLLRAGAPGVVPMLPLFRTATSPE